MRDSGDITRRRREIAGERRDPIARWVQLLAGLLGIGVAAPLMIRSGLGLGPWDAFHVGLHHITGMSVGVASIGVGLVVLLGSTRFGVRPGAGTLANMVLVGIFIDLLLPRVPPAQTFAVGLCYYSVAIVLGGISTGLYMGAGLGHGPRDGLMMGLSRTTGWPVRRVRTGIEMCALLGGWMMGGAIGIGTLIFAVSIGPAVQLGLQLFGNPSESRRDSPAIAHVAATVVAEAAARPVPARRAVA
jgi:uncharacterized protein